MHQFFLQTLRHCSEFVTKKYNRSKKEKVIFTEEPITAIGPQSDALTDSVSNLVKAVSLGQQW